jgi:AAA+ superfamily predicted ATPase
MLKSFLKTIIFAGTLLAVSAGHIYGMDSNQNNNNQQQSQNSVSSWNPVYWTLKGILNGTQQAFAEAGPSQKTAQKIRQKLKEARKAAIEDFKNELKDEFKNELGMDIGDFPLYIRNQALKNLWLFGGSAALLVATPSVMYALAHFSGQYAYWLLTTPPEPPIFIDSSEKSRWQRLKDTILFRQEQIPSLIYPAVLHLRLDTITRLTIHNFSEINKAGKKNIFYEPVLLYGPPGTGKSAAAQKMIREINKETKGGMPWRRTSGSLLLNAGINGINKMFEWANKQKAVCIFIDEADALFLDRTKLEENDPRLAVVDHLLTLLGERSNKFMIIMATNYIAKIDEAMHRRIDNLILIPLPGNPERIQVLKLYRDSILLNVKDNDARFIASIREHLSDSAIEQIAQRTDGLSNGDLQGIISKIGNYSRISAQKVVSPAVIEQAVTEYLEKHATLLHALNTKQQAKKHPQLA